MIWRKIRFFGVVIGLMVGSLAVPMEVAASSEETETKKNFYTGCDEGYYINPETGRCNKVKVCKTGYLYKAETNSCHKMVCAFGYKAGTDSLCHKLECNPGYILSLTTGNCVKQQSGITECDVGLAYDPSSKSCKEIFPENAPPCSDEEYLNRASMECVEIQNLEAYDTWLTEALVTTNDSTTISNGSLLSGEDGVLVLSVASAASTSGYTSELADIWAPEYEELREIITEYLEEQEVLKAEEEAKKAALAQKPSTGTTGSLSATKICPAGKVLNPKTNRCKTAVTVSRSRTSITTTTFNPITGKTTTVKTCVVGYTLNSLTNRCVRNAKKAKATKTCPAGKFLNPKTNRCKNLVTAKTTATSVTTTTYDPLTGEATTVKTCKDGYKLNPDTNRCNKIKKNNGEKDSLEVPDLGFATEDPQMFIAVVVVVVAGVTGVGLVIFQFRKELGRILRKIFSRRR